MDGIPVASTRSLTAVPDTVPQLEALVYGAVELKEAPAVILDMRSYMGQNDWYAMEWVRRFAGVDVCPASFHAQLVTDTAGKMLDNCMSSFGLDWSATPGSPLDGDSDGPSDVSSRLAGESFVGCLCQLENVVFVGTNAYVMMLAGNTGVCTLPNSEVVLVCGSRLALGEDLLN
ncbi:MAG: hypothetical protein WAO51_07565 [Bacillota bacterium]